MNKTTLWIFSFLLLTISANAQSVAGYIFSESTEEYVPLEGTVSTATGDDGAQNNIALGFDFQFGGQEYNVFSISANGFIRLGNDIAEESWENSLSTEATQSPLIAPFWDDHNVGTGNVSYALTGVTPQRTLEVDWNEINTSGGGSESETEFGSFKIRLYENSGIIEFVYGSVINPVTDFNASIGINDLTSFLSITPSPDGAMTSYISPNNEVNSSGSLTGRKYTFTPIEECSTAPDPGDSISSEHTVCEDVQFVLSLENLPQVYGWTYQWQSAIAGEDFIDIEDANSPELLTSQLVETTYRNIVSCGAEASISTPITVTMTASGNCYCFPAYNAGKTDGDLISNVEIIGTTLSNNSGSSAENPSYTYFSGEPNYTAELQAGGIYELAITVGSYGEQKQAAWIDYNDDTIFTQNERVGYSTAPVNGGETGTFSIQLACDAPVGIHRLRIRDVYNINAITMDPCLTYDYGEAEDYDIIITAGEQCPLPYALNVSSYNSSAAQLSWSAACNQTNWDVSVVPSGSAAGGNVYENVTSPFLVFALEESTAYDFYVMAECEEGGSGWAGPYSFTTSALAVPNDDCEIAFPLQVGDTFAENAVTASNIGATKTLGEPAVSCAHYAFGGDVWFSVVVPESGNVNIETQMVAGSAVTDTGLAVYSGSCGGALITLGCSDDAIGNEGFSRLELSGLVAGTTIYARAWEYANDSYGMFRVSAWYQELDINDVDVYQLSVYPNPVREVLYFSNSSSRSISSVTLYNLLGQRIMERQLLQGEKHLDMSHIPDGHYLGVFRSGDGHKTIKIIKE